MPNEPTEFYQRICLRCQQPIAGYSFYTLYGFIDVRAPGPTRDGGPFWLQVHAAGEAVHDLCPHDNQPRVVVRETNSNDEERRGWSNVAPGVDYNAGTNKYYARVDNPHFKKRLGSYPTQEEAEHVRADFLAALERPRKRKRQHAKR